MTQLKTKPSGIYYIDVEVPCDKSPSGLKRSRISLDTRDKGEAELQRRDWIAGVHPKHPNMGGVVAPKGRVSNDNASVSAKKRDGSLSLGVWLTRCLGTIWHPRECKAQKTARSNVKQLCELFGDDTKLVDVTSDLIAKKVTELREQGLAEGTIRRKINALSAALTQAVKQKDDAGQPFLAVRPQFPEWGKLRNTQDRIISRVEEEAILEAIDRRIEAEPARPWWKFKAFVIIGLDLGFRAGETLSCGPRSIREKRWLEIGGEVKSGLFLGLERYATKNDKPRDVPCTDRVIRLFPALNAQAVKGRWFPWAQGGTGTWYMWDNIRKDLEKMGHDLSDVKQHTFRHTCATRLAEGGLDLVSLRDWLGHSDIRITAERYIHLMSTHLHRGAIILNGGPVVLQEAPADVENEPSGIQNYTISGTNRAGAGTPALH